MISYDLIISLFHHFIISSFYQFIISSFHHFIISSFHHFITSSLHHVITSSCHHLNISTSQHLINSSSIISSSHHHIITSSPPSPTKGQHPMVVSGLLLLGQHDVIPLSIAPAYHPCMLSAWLSTPCESALPPCGFFLGLWVEALAVLSGSVGQT